MSIMGGRGLLQYKLNGLRNRYRSEQLPSSRLTFEHSCQINTTDRLLQSLAACFTTVYGRDLRNSSVTLDF